MRIEFTLGAPPLRFHLDLTVLEPNPHDGQTHVHREPTHAEIAEAGETLAHIGQSQLTMHATARALGYA